MGYTYMIVAVIGTMLIPIYNREDKIDFYDCFSSANIDRIYYQSDMTETLKVIKL